MGFMLLCFSLLVVGDDVKNGNKKNMVQEFHKRKDSTEWMLFFLRTRIKRIVMMMLSNNYR